MRTDGLPIVADPNDPVTYSRFDPIHVARTATTTERARKAYADNADTDAAYLDGYLTACREGRETTDMRVADAKREGSNRGIIYGVFGTAFAMWLLAFLIGMAGV